MAIVDFLKTQTSKDELAVALKVLREFKDCESEMEWAFVPFLAWSKLEQMREFLEHMVEGAPLDDDTRRAIVRRAAELVEEKATGSREPKGET